MRRVPTGRCWPVAALCAFGAALAGCSSSSFTTPASNFSSFFASASNATTASGGTPDPSLDFECPSVSVRAGASTMTYSANPQEDSAMNLRYQVTVGQTARECKLNAGNVQMRVGVQGRVILGPAGTPGNVDLPVRLAVVHEGPSPKTITTKLNRVPVTIPPGENNVQYTMIEEDISFPMPRGGAIDEYIVYVGFDPQGMREQPKRPARSPKPQR